MDRSLIEGIWIERICLFLFIFIYFHFLQVFFNYFYGFISKYLSFDFVEADVCGGRKRTYFLERVQESDNLITLGFVEEFTMSLFLLFDVYDEQSY